MLYNYPNIDKLIENRKLELIDKINTNCYELSRSNTSITSNTLEDIVESFDTDSKLNRLNKWKKIIERFLNCFNYNSLIKRFINNKYFLNASNDEVKSSLHKQTILLHHLNLQDTINYIISFQLTCL